MGSQRARRAATEHSTEHIVRRARSGVNSAPHCRHNFGRRPAPGMRVGRPRALRQSRQVRRPAGSEVVPPHNGAPQRAHGVSGFRVTVSSVRVRFSQVNGTVLPYSATGNRVVALPRFSGERNGDCCVRSQRMCRKKTPFTSACL